MSIFDTSGLPGTTCSVDSNCSSFYLSPSQDCLNSTCSCHATWTGDNSFQADEDGRCARWTGFTYFSSFALVVAFCVNSYIVVFATRTFCHLGAKKRRSAVGSSLAFVALATAFHQLFVLGEALYRWNIGSYVAWVLLAGLSNAISPIFHFAATLNLPLMQVCGLWCVQHEILVHMFRAPSLLTTTR